MWLVFYNASGESHSKDAMTLTDWKKLVDGVIKEGGIFQCIISGGDSLLKPPCNLISLKKSLNLPLSLTRFCHKIRRITLSLIRLTGCLMCY
jgi:hypothetical protein